MPKPRSFIAGFALTVIVLTAFIPVLPRVISAEPTTEGRITHVGLIWLKDPGNIANRKRLISALHLFAREIPEVKSVSVGQAHPSNSKLVDSTFDVCFTMEFENYAALERYSKNPVHEKAAQEAFLPVSQKILFYDFIKE